MDKQLIEKRDVSGAPCTDMAIASTSGNQPEREKTRTVHSVYELPDWHPHIRAFEDREPDESPYLLVTWESADRKKSASEDHVVGTILIPCRTALGGRFPLDGTHFQRNEVFFDYETSKRPIRVPLKSLKLRKTLYCGSGLSEIAKGLSQDDSRSLFNECYLCTRGIDRKTGFPKPLDSRYHKSS